MKLNIIGYKTKNTEELQEIREELQKAIKKLTWDCQVAKALERLFWQIKLELDRRGKSKKVLVKFTAIWSGYTSTQRKKCAVEYRKIDRNTWEKMPKTFIHKFTDNTENLWSAEIVYKKDEPAHNSYGYQVDNFLNTYLKN